MFSILKWNLVHFQWRIQDFPEGGANLGGRAPTYYLEQFLCKLQENEKNWTERWSQGFTTPRSANNFLNFISRWFSGAVSWILKRRLVDSQVWSRGIWGEVSCILQWSLAMAERGPLDDVNTVIASLYERVSGELLPRRGHQSDREIIASLAADPGVLEALSFPREALRQNKNLTLAKQLLAQGEYRDVLRVIY